MKNLKGKRKFSLGFLSSLFTLLLLAFVSMAGQCADEETINAISGKRNYELTAYKMGSGEKILHRTAYTVSYNPQRRVPNWVAWRLSAWQADGQVPRPQNAFREDSTVATPRATLADYRGSGWDRGHMCPAGDCKWNAKAMYESFLLTNMCPQAPKLNSGDWNEIEALCRSWASKYGTIYVVTGPIFTSKRPKTIGPNKVAVPDAFFKAVVRLGKRAAGIAFVCKNNEKNNLKPADYVVTIDKVERLTGYDLFASLSDNIETSIEAHADISQW